VLDVQNIRHRKKKNQNLTLQCVLIHGDAGLTFVVGSSASPSWPRAFSDLLSSLVCGAGALPRLEQRFRGAVCSCTVGLLSSVTEVWSLEQPDWHCKIDEGSAGLVASCWSPDGRHILNTTEFHVSVKSRLLSGVSDVTVCPLPLKIT